MLRRCRTAGLKARPKTVNTEVGSNRTLPPAIYEKMKANCTVPPHPGKRVIHNWRFFVKPGKAATGPPVGQQFSTLGLKPMDFCKAFNDKTKPVFKDDVELQLRVQVYHDLTYSWRVESPPTSWFILRATKKKRRDTGPLAEKQGFACYMTLEMCYEIAKYKQFNWGRYEYPPIEKRARRIAQQARRMGIAIIGVDVPNSPVVGKTAAQYEKESAEYRTQQWKQYEELKKKELEDAPLYASAHQPDLVKLDYSTLQKLAKDPSLLSDVHALTKPKSKYSKDRSNLAEAYSTLMGHAVGRQIKRDGGSVEEIGKAFYNWRVPDGAEPAEETPYWTRDAMRTGKPSG